MKRATALALLFVRAARMAYAGSFAPDAVAEPLPMILRTARAVHQAPTLCCSESEDTP